MLSCQYKFHRTKTVVRELKIKKKRTFCVSQCPYLHVRHLVRDMLISTRMCRNLRLVCCVIFLTQRCVYPLSFKMNLMEFAWVDPYIYVMCYQLPIVFTHIILYVRGDQLIYNFTSICHVHIPKNQLKMVKPCADPT